MIKLALCYASLVKENKAAEFPFAPLALSYIAAHTPGYYDISLYDEIVGEDMNPDTIDADLVAISSLSLGINRACEISDKLRKRGITTAIGGLHASALPQEVEQHFDSVITGEGEKPWQQFLIDFENGNCQKLYVGQPDFSLEHIGIPRRDIIHPNYASHAIQTSRGCPFHCSFCFQSVFNNRKYRFIPHDTVLEDLESLRGNQVLVFSDDNFIGNTASHIEDRKILLEKMIRRNFKFMWGVATTVETAQDPELMSLMYRAGCRLLYIGLETFIPDELRNMNKRHNLGIDYSDAVKKIHKHNITVVASVILGMDSQIENYHEVLIKELKRSRVEFVQVHFMSAYPGTPYYERLCKENRASSDWDNLRPEIPTMKFKHYTHESAILARKEIIKSFFNFSYTLQTLVRWIFKEPSVIAFFIKIWFRNQTYERVREKRAKAAAIKK